MFYAIHSFIHQCFSTLPFSVTFQAFILLFSTNFFIFFTFHCCNLQSRYFLIFFTQVSLLGSLYCVLSSSYSICRFISSPAFICSFSSPSSSFTSALIPRLLPLFCYFFSFSSSYSHRILIPPPSSFLSPTHLPSILCSLMAAFSFSLFVLLSLMFLFPPLLLFF